MSNGTAGVTGVGYLGPGCYGMARRGVWNSYREIGEVCAFMKRDSLDPSSKRFGRFDLDSKRVSIVAGLALSDAGIATHSTAESENVGMLAVNREGALRTNIEYFGDYLRSGRTLGRAILFIYTLPTSPLAEAAIHYGLRGPLVYAAREDCGEVFALRYAETMLQDAVARVVAIVGDSDETTCFIVESLPQGAGGVTPSVEATTSLLAHTGGSPRERLEGIWKRQ